jgi:hypothetical protein
MVGWAFSLKDTEQKIALLKSSKDYTFKEIKVPYDPFYKAKKIVSLKKKKHKAKKVKKTYPRLVTILNNQAFINGRWYKKDDLVNGMIVKKIYTDHIILRKGGKKVVLKIEQNRRILNIVEKHK